MIVDILGMVLGVIVFFLGMVSPGSGCKKVAVGVEFCGKALGNLSSEPQCFGF